MGVPDGRWAHPLLHIIRMYRQSWKAMNFSNSSEPFSMVIPEPLTTKWLRFIRPTVWSGPHFDFVYMGRGSAQLHTCWVPFGDVPATMGTLTVLVGSHNLPSFAPIRDTYGRTDVDRDGTPGHFGRDPMEISDKYGGEWQTADFEMGGCHCLHDAHHAHLYEKPF